MARALGALILLALLLATAAAPLAEGGPSGPVPSPARSLANGRSAEPASAPSLAPPLAGPSAVASQLARLPPSPTPSNVLVDAPCNVTGNAEVQQAFDPTLGYLYEAWIGCGGIGFSRSTDLGRTFGPAMTVPGSAPSGGGSWDPAIALAPNGTVYVAFMVSVPGDTPAVAWSWDHGQSFAGNATVFVPPGNTFSDRDFLAVAPNGTLYVTWDYSPMVYWPNNSALDVLGCAAGGSCYFTNGDYNIVISSSSDGGQTWSAFAPVDPEYPWGGAPCGPLQVAPNGTLEVLYEDYDISGGDHALGLGYNYYTSSSDGGQSWSSRVRVANLSFPNTDWWINGAITSDRSGTLYATFDSMVGPDDTAYVGVSQDGGSTWPIVRAMNPDSDSAAHVMATGAGGENGTVYLAWMSNESGNWSTYERALSGNGSTFGPATVVSDRPGIPGYWIGDTIGLSYLGSGAVAVSWSYGVTQGGVTASQVYEALLPEAPPGPPASVALLPGHGNVTVSWTPPSGPEPIVFYQLFWGVEGSWTYNLTLPPTNRSFTISGLLPFTRYQVELTPFDAAGAGPWAGPVNLTLTAWSRFGGQVTPPTSTVTLDTQPVNVSFGQYLTNVSYGPHLLAVQSKDYGTRAMAVLPTWNGTTFTNVSLSLLPGVVQGNVVPTTASLTWEGGAVAVSAAGYFSFSAPAGSQGLLTASLPLFHPTSVSVTVPANASVWANLTLTPVNGTLALLVHPTNASVTVNGSAVPLDRDGNATVPLAPGTYPVEISCVGYLTRFYNTSVVSANVTSLHVNLTAATTTEPPRPGPSPSFWGFLSDPALWVLLVGALAISVIAVLWLRRRPPAESPAAEMPESPVVEDTEGIDVTGPADPGPPV